MMSCCFSVIATMTASDPAAAGNDNDTTERHPSDVHPSYVHPPYRPTHLLSTHHMSIHVHLCPSMCLMFLCPLITMPVQFLPTGIAPRWRPCRSPAARPAAGPPAWRCSTTSAAGRSEPVSELVARLANRKTHPTCPTDIGSVHKYLPVCYTLS